MGNAGGEHQLDPGIRQILGGEVAPVVGNGRKRLAFASDLESESGDAEAPTHLAQPPRHSGGGGLQRQGLNEQVASATNSCSQRISGAQYGSGMEASSLPGDDSRRSTSLASRIRTATPPRTADHPGRRRGASPAWWLHPA